MYYEVTFYRENIIAGLAEAATIIQFLSGVLVCKQYVYNKTTGDASALPFLLGVLSCGVWWLYGGLKDDDTIMIVNIVGFFLMVFYVIVFYKFTFKNKCLQKQILASVMFAIFIFGYLLHDDDLARQEKVLGSIACSLTLLTIAAPLVKLYHVIQVKSTECLPFPIILMSCFVSGLWFLYGFLHNDAFLIVPNVIGGVLATCQLCLFMIYPNTPHSPGAGKALIA